MFKRMIALSMTLGMASQLCAGVIATESFDYEVGSISTKNGGAGWSNAWSQQSAAGGSGTSSVSGSSLTFSNYETSGGSLEVKLDDAIGRGAFQTQYAIRNLGSVPASGQDLWVSFLYKNSGTITNSIASRQIELRHGGFQFRIRPKDGGHRGVAIGYDGGSFQRNNDEYIQDGGTYLFIARFDIGDGGSSSQGANLWVLNETSYDLIKNGGITLSELNSGAFTSVESTKKDKALGSNAQLAIGLSTSTDEGLTSLFDEFKYGTALEDVIGNQVPEPASMLSIMAGVGVLSLVRRRK
ncbi:PEP-CTERM sorting domain-containing protein [Poriferisphaera sp. WC338]|uniref:PEP-CTERM sorting domain-containing protein n=1 Tax=Poriferisphaera sp. WC338 TaxID=3425129 RepID=UPI003D816A03